MSSIPVLPGVGTQPASIAVAILPDGSAAPLHGALSSSGTSVAPMTDASAQAFAIAVAAFVAALMPQAVIAQKGPFVFGFPL